MSHQKLYGRKLQNSEDIDRDCKEFLLKGPFWIGFRKGCRYVAPLWLAFALLSLAVANGWYELFISLSCLVAAVICNVLVFTSRKEA